MRGGLEAPALQRRSGIPLADLFAAQASNNHPLPCSSSSRDDRPRSRPSPTPTAPAELQRPIGGEFGRWISRILTLSFGERAGWVPAQCSEERRSEVKLATALNAATLESRVQEQGLGDLVATGGPRKSSRAPRQAQPGAPILLGEQAPRFMIEAIWASIPTCASGIRCWAAFCHAADSAVHFPATEESALQFATMFASPDILYACFKQLRRCRCGGGVAIPRFGVLTAPSMLAAVPQLCLDALDDAAWAARSQPPSPLSPASTLGLPASFGRTYLAARAFDPPRGGRRVAREGSWWQVQEVESGGSVRIFQTGAQGTEFCLMAHPSGVVVVSEADADVGRSSLWKAEQVEGRAGALRLQCSSGAQGAGAGGEGAYLVASTSRRLTVARLPPGSWPASSEWQLEAA
ncbi:unnamed protein product, partial [Prorocentrum cordatum]